MNTIDFFLNTSDKAEEGEKAPVSAPTFSIVKVLTAAAVVVAPITTAIVDQIQDGKLFTSWQYVTLAMGVLALVAVLGAADVLARSFVTGKVAAEGTALANIGHLLPFEESFPGHVRKGGAHVDILAAAEADRPYYLVVETADGKKKINWMPVAEVAVEIEK